MGADLVVTPELSLIGYPPKDLLLKPAFVADNLAALEQLVAQVGRTALLVGYVDRTSDGAGACPSRNAVALVAGGRILATKHKSLLPTYDVFDEMRYFEPGEGHPVVALKDLAIGLSICEDIWTEEPAGPVARHYHGNPIADLVGAGADILVNMSASPFVMGKMDQRAALVRAQAVKYGRPVVYVNQVGGNDELIFDGASFAMDAEGRVVGQLRAFEEDLGLVDLPGGAPPAGLARTAARHGLAAGGPRAGRPRLHGQVRFPVGGAGPVGRHRLQPCRLPGRRGPRPPERPGRGHAQPLLQHAQPGRRPGPGREPGPSSSCVVPIDGPHRAFEQALAEAFRGPRPT